jgi:tetratricopeptide (TPR) repeat protein
VMGLAVTHQYAILVFYPGVLIFIGVNGGLKLKWQTWLLAIFLAIVGFTPYIYLPLVHYKTPLGEVVFVQNEAEGAQVPMDKVAVIDKPFTYFWDYFTRRQYSKSRIYTHSREAMPERTTTPMVLKRTIQTSEEDFSVPLLIFGFVGWLAVLISLRRPSWRYNGADPPISRAALLPLALGYILYFLVVHFYPSGDILAAPIENLEVVVPPLLIPLEAALAGIIAVGFDASSRWIAAYIRSQGVVDVYANQKYRTFAGLLAIAAFSLVIVNAWRNSEYGDKSQHVIAYNYALNVLDSCDPDAILLTTGDETFLYWYLRYCEPSDDPNDPTPGYRKDVWATNWIQNLPTLELLRSEANAMKTIAERFVVSSTYYSPFLQNYGIVLMEPDYGPRPLNSTFVTDTFADSDLLMALDCVLQGLVYTFRRPGDVPDISEPGVERSMDFGAVEKGGKALEVIDYFDARPFDDYRYEGLPGFEGVAEDFSNLDTAPYVSMRLEAQELEVLGRYQDSLYRFGIQALLQDTPESTERAVRYLFDTVSLNPADWFGWKELGDAFFATGRLDSAKGAYEQLLMIAAATGTVSVNQESAAYAQLGHIALIQGDLVESRQQVSLALALNPDNQLALAVLDELDRRASEEPTAGAEQEVQEETEESTEESIGESLGEEESQELEEFDDVEPEE